MNAVQRWRQRNPEKAKLQTKLSLRKLRRSPESRLGFHYSSLKARSLGKTKQKTWAGLEFISKEAFLCWAGVERSYFALFRAWEKSGFKNKLAPSLDRIDNSKGYVLGNLQWLTRSANTAKQYE